MTGAIVTGANGFVGSALVRELVAHGVSVAALTHGGRCENLPKSELIKVIPFELDKVEDVECHIDIGAYDVFYHFAWQGSAGVARADFQKQLQNALWSVECVKLAKKLGCSHFVGAGSIIEYETFDAAFAPENRPGLGYIYGSGKLVAHTMCKAVAADIGIDLVWGMITNAYGAGELSPRFINTTLRKILKGEPLQFTSGTQNYDFMYIDDVARAFYLLGEKGKPFCEYMIGSQGAKPLRQFILEIKEAVAPDRKFVFGDIPFSGTNLPLSVFDSVALAKDTGFKPEVSFSEGIKKTYEWLKELEENNCEPKV